ncbi:MAG: 1,2-phenylacetyl-CoA epoxidase subunit PaaD [Pseudomonadota bacterium]
MLAVADIARARDIAGNVPDPEIPVVTIADLGILRDVQLQGDKIEVTIIPTYSGCPAMNVIAQDIETALHQGGFADVQIRLLQSPAWTTDFISEEGKEKLKRYGIAPPQKGSEHPSCPQCGSARTEKISQFGSTACKALWRCMSCREPFDYFKCL